MLTFINNVITRFIYQDEWQANVASFLQQKDSFKFETLSLCSLLCSLLRSWGGSMLCFQIDTKSTCGHKLVHMYAMIIFISCFLACINYLLAKIQKQHFSFYFDEIKMQENVAEAQVWKYNPC